MENKCYMGYHTASECNKESYTKKKGISEVILTAEEVESVCWKANVPTPINTVDFLCYHHEYVYFKNAQYTSSLCVDPFKVHNGPKKAKGTKAVNLMLAKRIRAHLGGDIKPGDLLCPRCVQRVNKLQNESELDNDKVMNDTGPDADDDFLAVDQTCNSAIHHDKLNSSLSLIGESPLSMHSVAESRKAEVCQKKLKKVVKNLGQTMADVVQVPSRDVLPSEDMFTSDDVKRMETAEADLNGLMDDVKQKFHLVSYSEKVQILTFKPNSWTYDKTKNLFGQECSKHMIKRAH